MNITILKDFNVGFELEFIINTQFASHSKEIISQTMQSYKPKKIGDFDKMGNQRNAKQKELFSQNLFLVNNGIAVYNTTLSLSDNFEIFLANCANFYPDTPWKKIMQFDHDISLKCKNHQIPIEIKTRKINALEGYHVISQLLDILQYIPYTTNNTCGMHINLSHNQKKHTQAQLAELAILISQNFPISKINQIYQRENNKYCIPNDIMILDHKKLHQIFTEASSFAHQHFLTKVNTQNLTIKEISSISDQFIANMQSPEFKQVFDFYFNKGIAKYVETDWNEYRPAIAPRNNRIEFRSIGGADYPFMQKEIKQQLLQFCRAYKQNLLILEKNITPNFAKQKYI